MKPRCKSAFTSSTSYSLNQLSLSTTITQNASCYKNSLEDLKACLLVILTVIYSHWLKLLSIPGILLQTNSTAQQEILPLFSSIGTKEPNHSFIFLGNWNSLLVLGVNLNWTSATLFISTLVSCFNKQFNHSINIFYKQCTVVQCFYY